MASPTEPPPLPASFSRDDLKAVGFTGWCTWAELRESEFAEVPCKPGAYVVYRPSDADPEFIHPSPAGWLKGDPTEPVTRLREEWVDAVHVVYIGKADLRKRRRKVEALRRRLDEFARFGAGDDTATHWGGRLIWQLADADELLIAWHDVTWAETGLAYEKRLLKHFAELHDERRPFASLTG